MTDKSFSFQQNKVTFDVDKKVNDNPVMRSTNTLYAQIKRENHISSRQMQKQQVQTSISNARHNERKSNLTIYTVNPVSNYGAAKTHTDGFGAKSSNNNKQGGPASITETTSNLGSISQKRLVGSRGGFRSKKYTIKDLL